MHEPGWAGVKKAVHPQAFWGGMFETQRKRSPQRSGQRYSASAWSALDSATALASTGPGHSFGGGGGGVADIQDPAGLRGGLRHIYAANRCCWVSHSHRSQRRGGGATGPVMGSNFPPPKSGRRSCPSPPFARDLRPQGGSRRIESGGRGGRGKGEGGGKGYRAAGQDGSSLMPYSSNTVKRFATASLLNGLHPPSRSNRWAQADVLLLRRENASLVGHVWCVACGPWSVGYWA